MSDIYAISDLEGLSPSHVFPLYSEILQGRNELVICGDILDSTSPGINFGTFENDSKYNKKEKESIRQLFSVKANNIKTIVDIITNDNIKLAFGNRDLNKLKVLPLTRLNLSTNNTELKNFNSGNLDINIETYKKIQKIVGKSWYSKMSNWYPFWGGAMDKKENKSYWKNDNLPGKGFFYDRFTKIFGADTTEGTMSAQNLKYTIVKELGLYNVEEKLFGEEVEDYFAFIVLAVFRSMLLKTTLDYNMKESEIYNFFYNKSNLKYIIRRSHINKWQVYGDINQNMFKGLLYIMFTQDKNNMIITKCGRTMISDKCTDTSSTFLFSHGGVTKDIIESNTIKEIKQEIGQKSRLKQVITDAAQLGGFHKRLDDGTLFTDIKTPINNFNISMKQVIKDIFEEVEQMSIPSDNMLVLLIASATIDCESLKQKLSSSIDCNQFNFLKKKSDILSTMAGIKRLRIDEYIFFHKNNLYNIFGHNPNGFGTSTSLYERSRKLSRSRQLISQGDNKTYLVNLDTSNTFIGTLLNASISNTQLQTSSYVKIHNNDVSIKTHIFIETEKKFTIPANDIFAGIDNNHIIAFNENSKHFTNNNLTEIKINNTVSDNDKHLRIIKNNNNIFFHGVTTYRFRDYIVFSYHKSFGPPFPKCIFIMKKDEFENYFSQQSYKQSYKQKYLKYKAKYIELKNIKN